MMLVRVFHYKQEHIQCEWLQFGYPQLLGILGVYNLKVNIVEQKSTG
jgi:hypothetical protein